MTFQYYIFFRYFTLNIKKIIHSSNTSFIIVGYNIVKSPLGMHGIRLEINTHIITANKNAIEDIIESCKRLGLKIKDIVL